ncbi:uncharacterized protein LOC130745067 [Lotus japonicus]|uniref:uncharacterized protein LOC130745067 n=1 Tax=Lotus japonicus TaxID=34305 RepID=UPI002588DA54|nr:uncharacterized protein LOC130745067 [Lotus japonicus]
MERTSLAGLTLRMACSDALPVKAALYRRRISPDPTCNFCGQDEESITHALLDCEWTRPVWFASQIQLNPSALGASSSFKGWLLGEIKILETNKDFFQLGMMILVHTLWGSWKERNDCYFQRRQPAPGVVAMKINSHIEESSTMVSSTSGRAPDLNSAMNGGSHRDPQSRANENLSLTGYIRINMDAAFSNSSCRGTLGVIVNDESGAQILTHANSFFAISPLAAEANALREALVLASNLQLGKCIFASYYKELISLEHLQCKGS